MENKRNTVQRQLILNAVKELNTHATAEHVYDYVIRQYPSISKATVYRNLSQMVDAGELLNIGSFHGSTRYDHHCHEHYHFVCNKCRRVYNIDGDFSDVCNKVEGTDGFEITDYHISFSGLCKDCK